MGKGPNRDIVDMYKHHAKRVSDYAKRMRRTIYRMHSREEADVWYKRYITGAYTGWWYVHFDRRDAEKAHCTVELDEIFEESGITSLVLEYI